MPRLLGQPLRFSCWSRETENDSVFYVTKNMSTAEIGGFQVPCKDLPSALESFQRVGTEALRRTMPYSSWEPQWTVASDLVEAALSGVMRHLPQLRPKVEVRDLGARMHGFKADGFASELVSISVDYGQPVIGEIATLSRCACEFRFNGIVRFALQCPVKNPDGTVSLTLRVHGFEAPALQETADLRRRLIMLLGEGGFTKQAAFEWWMQNKDQEFPLENSKFHRLYESLFGQAGLKLLPKQIRVDAFWGYLHNPGTAFSSFSVLVDRCGNTTISAQQVPADTVQDAKLRDQCRTIAQDILRDNRVAADRFAASATNFCAMMYGHEVNQPNARASAIVKLFSAAQWWGPGTEGWQRYDQTWLCTDKRNRFGFVVEEQGRIFWQLEAERLKIQKKPVNVAYQSEWPLFCPRLNLLCCRRRAHVCKAPSSQHAPAAER